MESSNQVAQGSATDQIVLNLIRSQNGETLVHSIEVIGSAGRLRYKCAGNMHMPDVFHESTLDKIDYLVEESKSVDGLLSLPDYRVNLNGLFLTGCRILVNVTKDGVENIMVRFSKFHGQLTKLFAPSFRHKDAFVTEGVDRAVDALEKVYLPLRNFAKFLDRETPQPTGFSEPTQESQFLSKVKDQISELDFYMDMITHYVNSRAKLDEDPAPIRRDIEIRSPKDIIYSQKE